MSSEHEATQMLQRPDEALLRAAAERRARRTSGRAPQHEPAPVSPPSVAAPITPVPARILPATAPVSALKPHVYDPIRRSDVDLGNALLGIWPRSGFGPLATPAHVVREVIEELTGLTATRFDFHGLRIIEPGSDWPDVGHAALWRVELPPSPDYGIVSVDQSLVDPVLGAMLAESTGGVRRVGSLSTRDHGLFSFVMLRVLDALVERHGMPPFVMAVEPPSREEATGLTRRAGGVVEAVFVVSTPTSAGFVRFFLPTAMVRKLGVWRETHPLAWQGVQLGALSKSEVSTPVRLATLTLGQVDAWELQPGDVILPSAHGLSEEWAQKLGVQSGDIQTARLHLDARQSIGVTLGVDSSLGQWTCTIEDIQIERLDHKKEDTMSQTNQNAPEHTSDLLREVNMELEVRLAGVTMSVEELASMQVGQVIGLGIPIGEPVELHAGGRRLGRGELVNVEGTLGVRVLSRQ